MKKMYMLVVALSVLLLSINLNAQDYRPCLVDSLKIKSYSGMSWHEMSIRMSDEEDGVFYAENSYSDGQGITTERFREDENGCVYKIVGDKSFSEIMIIDMRLKVGEVFSLDDVSAPDTVVSVYEDKDGRKTIVFDRKVEYRSGDLYHNPFIVEDSLKFIEGLGSNVGLNYRDRINESGSYDWILSCVTEKEELVYEIDNPNFESCELKEKARVYQSVFGKKETKFNVLTGVIFDSFAPSFKASSTDSIVNPFGACETNIFYIDSKDTLFDNGNTYHVLKKEYYNELIYVREDTLTGRIFRYYPEFDIKQEVITCDMSLEEGDSFTFPKIDVSNIPSYDRYEYGYREENKTTVVDSVRYIDGRKVIYFKQLNSSEYYDDVWLLEYGVSIKFIEGVGPTYGIMGYSYNPVGGLGVLLCAEKDGEQSYITNELLGCNITDNAATSVDEITEKLLIYPNPIRNELSVELTSGDVINGEINIINSNGRTVLQYSVINNQSLKIDTSNLPSGIYIVVLTIDKKVITEKIIKI